MRSAAFSFFLFLLLQSPHHSDGFEPMTRANLSRPPFSPHRPLYSPRAISTLRSSPDPETDLPLDDQFKVTDLASSTGAKGTAPPSSDPEPPTDEMDGSIFAQRPLTSESLSDRVNELKTSDDPKQTRVILYILVSLVPVLFLVPLMLGRELVPLDTLPPVEL